MGPGWDTPLVSASIYSSGLCLLGNRPPSLTSLEHLMGNVLPTDCRVADAIGQHRFRVDSRHLTLCASCLRTKLYQLAGKYRARRMFRCCFWISPWTVHCRLNRTRVSLNVTHEKDNLVEIKFCDLTIVTILFYFGSTAWKWIWFHDIFCHVNLLLLRSYCIKIHADSLSSCSM